MLADLVPSKHPLNDLKIVAFSLHPFMAERVAFGLSSYKHTNPIVGVPLS